ncbi:hypothetical protein R9C00_23490 [Flammeovirgaceae bacterium SG7u.111]|nr:hypothetical protein [Flammeovirgaceae bacterium SG7u.132]WPO34669.1 hypothetical protein R9C00_23490 [Flammeovirgaceae bacterium SG7u.111]
MKKTVIILVIGLLSFINIALAHSPKETYATLEIKNSNLIVTLDVPWSINNALREGNPYIKDDIDEDVFIEFAKTYLILNFEVRKEEELVRPTNIEILEGDHFHNARISIEFPCSELAGLSIKNTLLFNLNPNQRNYHKVKITDATPKNYITFQELPTFQIKGKSQMAGIAPITIGSIATLALISIFFLIVRNRKIRIMKIQDSSYSV